MPICRSGEPDWEALDPAVQERDARVPGGRHRRLARRGWSMSKAGALIALLGVLLSAAVGLLTAFVGRPAPRASTLPPVMPDALIGLAAALTMFGVIVSIAGAAHAAFRILAARGEERGGKVRPPLC